MLMMGIVLSAQTAKQDFERRYNLLVAKGGLAGVGVETLLENRRLRLVNALLSSLLYELVKGWHTAPPFLQK